MGSSYSKVDEQHDELGLWNLSGEAFRTYSLDDIAIRDYSGIDFEYSDINIIGCCNNKETVVAGYTTSDICLYFVYVPINGFLTHEERDSALYAAKYTFEPADIDSMSTDLIDKLTSIYGTPDDTDDGSDLWNDKYHYTFWFGNNNTGFLCAYRDPVGCLVAIACALFQNGILRLRHIEEDSIVRAQHADHAGRAGFVVVAHEYLRKNRPGGRFMPLSLHSPLEPIVNYQLQASPAKLR